MLKCNFETKEQNVRCKKEANTFRCGYTADIIQDEIRKVKLETHNDWKTLDSLTTDIRNVHKKYSYEPTMYILFRSEGILGHTMIWVITKTTAHTLQSWYKINTYEYWSMPLDKFIEAIQNIQSTDADMFRSAFTALTHHKVPNDLHANHKEYDAFQYIYAVGNVLGSIPQNGGITRNRRYESMTVAELQSRCYQRCIKYAGLRKEELISKLRGNSARSKKM